MQSSSRQFLLSPIAIPSQFSSFLLTTPFAPIPLSIHFETAGCTALCTRLQMGLVPALLQHSIAEGAIWEEEQMLGFLIGAFSKIEHSQD